MRPVRLPKRRNTVPLPTADLATLVGMLADGKLVAEVGWRRCPFCPTDQRFWCTFALDSVM
jgi:hypothetical protein